MANTTTNPYSLWNVVRSAFSMAENIVASAFSLNEAHKRQENELNGKPYPFFDMSKSLKWQEDAVANSHNWYGLDEMFGIPKLVDYIQTGLLFVCQVMLGIQTIILLWICVYVLQIIMPPVAWLFANLFSCAKYACTFYAKPKYARMIRGKGNSYY